MSAISVADFHGLTSEILDFTSIRGHVASNLAHHLAFFGTSLGRYPHVDWRGIVYPAMNWVIVGETSCGKGESLELISDIYNFDRRSQYLLAPSRRVSLTSGKDTIRYIYDELGEYEEGESRFLTINEEFVGQLNCLRIPTNKMAAVWITLSDGRPISETYGKERVALPEMHYGTIGHITPKLLVEGLSRGIITGGLANRMLFMGVPTPEYSFDAAPYSVSDMATIRDRIISSLKIGGERYLVGMEANALSRYQDFCRSWFEDKESDGTLRYLTARFPRHCLKVALIISLTNQEEKISVESMESAFAVMRHSRATLEKLFGGEVDSTPEQHIKEFIRTKGTATKTDITLTFAKKYTREEIDNSLLNMTEEGIIAVQVSTGARGRRSTTYTLTEERAAA